MLKAKLVVYLYFSGTDRASKICDVVLAKFLYGTGMRIMEAMQLRIKDVEFSQSTLIVR
jgi:site-specific recombinase XerD